MANDTVSREEFDAFKEHFKKVSELQDQSLKAMLEAFGMLKELVKNRFESTGRALDTQHGGLLSHTEEIEKVFKAFNELKRRFDLSQARPNYN